MSEEEVVQTDTGYLDAKSAAALDVELMSSPGFALEQLMELAGLAVAEAVYSVVQQQQFGSMMMMMVVCWMMFWRPMRETILERWFHSRSLHCFVPPARSRTGFCLDGNAITGFYIVTHFV